MATAAKSKPRTTGARRGKTQTVTLLELHTARTFVGREGREVEIKDADGRPSEAQVMALWKKGHLAIVAERVEPFTKGQASYAMDAL